MLTKRNDKRHNFKMYLRQNGYSLPVAKKYFPGAIDTFSAVCSRSDGITSFSDELNDE